MAESKSVAKGQSPSLSLHYVAQSSFSILETQLAVMITLLQSQSQRSAIPSKNPSEVKSEQTPQAVVPRVIHPVVANLGAHEVTNFQVPCLVVDLECKMEEMMT